MFFSTQFFRVVYTIWQREIIRYWRDRVRIISTFFQPIMFLVIFGAGLKQTLAAGNFGVDFVQFMYPGIIAMSVMGVAFFSTISTVWDREFGFLKEILVAPVSRTAIAFGKALGATSIASSQALLLLVLAPIVGVSLGLVVVPKLFIFMVLLAFSISGIGLFIASIMRTTESFGLIMQFLIFPMFFLSGAFFPLTAIPTWMSWIARLNPLSYGVDALRQILLAGQISGEVLERISVRSVSADAFFLVLLSIVILGAAVVSFNKRG